MSANIPNQVAFLRTSRSFPEDPQQLSVELDRMYLDVATAVNSRTIGIFAPNRPSVTGDSWFVNKNTKQQSSRQVYSFTAAGNIAHKISWGSVSSISPKSYGTFTDSTNWYGCIYGSSVSIAGQISFYVTPTNIVVLSGAGAPDITSGFIVLEWISNP